MEHICQICFDLPKQMVKKLQCWIARQSPAINNSFHIFHLALQVYWSWKVGPQDYNSGHQTLTEWENLTTMHKEDVCIISLSLQGVSKIILLLLEDAQVYVRTTVSSILGHDSMKHLWLCKVQILQTRKYAWECLKSWSILEELKSCPVRTNFRDEEERCTCNLN